MAFFSKLLSLILRHHIIAYYQYECADAGTVLSFAQWPGLRAGVGLGMPIIFEGIDLAFKVSQLWLSVLIATSGILAAGLVAGAIQARFLVQIAESQDR
jgi:hypothetical protein